jgi:N utilization substance protein A
MSVDVELVNEAVNVYYNRDLRARYAFASGESLALYEDLATTDAS